MMKKKRLHIGGQLLDLNSDDPNRHRGQRWVTTKIVKRISARKVATKKSHYVLEGPLEANPPDNSDGDTGDTPIFIIDKFADGFPSNWDLLVKRWIELRSSSELTKINNNSYIAAANELMNSTTTCNVSGIPGSPSNMSTISNLSSTASSSVLQVTKGGCVSILGQSSILQPKIPSYVVVHDDTCKSESPTKKVSEPAPVPSYGLSPPGESSLGSQTEQKERTMSIRKSRRILVTPSPQSTKMDHKKVPKEVPLEQDEDPPLNKTMTMSDISKMRAKTYQNISIRGKKKYYKCNMCDFKATQFKRLILHLKKAHFETVPTPCKSPAGLINAELGSEPGYEDHSFTHKKVADERKDGSPKKKYKLRLRSFKALTSLPRSGQSAGGEATRIFGHTTAANNNEVEDWSGPLACDPPSALLSMCRKRKEQNKGKRPGSRYLF